AAMTHRRHSVSGGLLLVELAVLIAAGCGGGKIKSTATTTTTTTTAGAAGMNSKIAAEVPANIKSKGRLTVATDATYPPNEFVGSNGKTLTGWDVELGQALGKVMGLNWKFVNAS